MNNRTNEYRAKAFELLSLAESVNDPEQRADMLRFAQMWMSLSEPLPDLRSAYELPRNERQAQKRPTTRLASRDSRKHMRKLRLR